MKQISNADYSKIDFILILIYYLEICKLIVSREMLLLWFLIKSKLLMHIKQNYITLNKISIIKNWKACPIYSNLEFEIWWMLSNNCFKKENILIYNFPHFVLNVFTLH